MSKFLSFYIFFYKFNLERDFRGLPAPSLGDPLLDFDPLLLGDFERDFLDEADPLLDLAFSEFALGLLDFAESRETERLRDFLAGDCGEPERERLMDSPEASISEDKNREFCSDKKCRIFTFQKHFSRILNVVIEDLHSPASFSIF
jgi:hypothetical protein